VNASAITSPGKRPRDSDAPDRPNKREKGEDSDDEMEIEDDEESPPKKDACTAYCFSSNAITEPQAAAPATVPSQVQQPTTRLLCQNLPQEVTDDVLAVLFQQ
jgi:hypothetical protein